MGGRRRGNQPPLPAVARDGLPVEPTSLQEAPGRRDLAAGRRRGARHPRAGAMIGCAARRAAAGVAAPRRRGATLPEAVVEEPPAQANASSRDRAGVDGEVLVVREAAGAAAAGRAGALAVASAAGDDRAREQANPPESDRTSAEPVTQWSYPRPHCTGLLRCHARRRAQVQSGRDDPPQRVPAVLKALG